MCPAGHPHARHRPGPDRWTLYSISCDRAGYPRSWFGARREDVFPLGADRLFHQIVAVGQFPNLSRQFSTGPTRYTVRQGVLHSGDVLCVVASAALDFEAAEHSPLVPCPAAAVDLRDGSHVVAAHYYRISYRLWHVGCQFNHHPGCRYHP